MKSFSNIKKATGALLCLSMFLSCVKPLTFSKEDLLIIGSDSTAGILPLYTIDDPADTAVLNAVSADLSNADLMSDYYKILKKRMLATVKDTSNEGVGIAAPQVGINKRLVAIQRFDKKGEPFEFFPNIRIVSLSKEKAWGWEGCLSVPGVRDTVLRSKSVIVTYIDDHTLTEKKDTITGFTAVIFQHEVDHLDGILFTERKLL